MESEIPQQSPLLYPANPPNIIPYSSLSLHLSLQVVKKSEPTMNWNVNSTQAAKHIVCYNMTHWQSQATRCLIFTRRGNNNSMSDFVMLPGYQHVYESNQGSSINQPKWDKDINMLSWWLCEGLLSANNWGDWAVGSVVSAATQQVRPLSTDFTTAFTSTEDVFLWFARHKH